MDISKSALRSSIKLYHEFGPAQLYEVITGTIRSRYRRVLEQKSVTYTFPSLQHETDMIMISEPAYIIPPIIIAICY